MRQGRGRKAGKPCWEMWQPPLIMCSQRLQTPATGHPRMSSSLSFLSLHTYTFPLSSLSLPSPSPTPRLCCQISTDIITQTLLRLQIKWSLPHVCIWFFKSSIIFQTHSCWRWSTGGWIGGIQSRSQFVTCLTCLLAAVKTPKIVLTDMLGKHVRCCNHFLKTCSQKCLIMLENMT